MRRCCGSRKRKTEIKYGMEQESKRISIYGCWVLTNS
jgi:hypothetical protein